MGCLFLFFKVIWNIFCFILLGFIFSVILYLLFNCLFFVKGLVGGIGGVCMFVIKVMMMKMIILMINFIFIVVFNFCCVCIFFFI